MTDGWAVVRLGLLLFGWSALWAAVLTQWGRP